MNNYIVYAHLNKVDNNKIYIGITCQKPKQRWSNGEGYRDCPRFYEAIQQYGWDNFDHVILFQDLTKEEAIEKEKALIALYDATDPIKGYNVSQGGGCGPGTKLFGQDHSLSIRVKCNETNEVFGSLSEAARWSGTGTSKISLNCRGHRAHAGTHPITKEKLTWCYTNEPVTMVCHDAKRNKPVQKVQCVETEEVYDSASDAHRQTGIATCNILRCCKGERKTAGKYHWKFYK